MEPNHIYQYSIVNALMQGVSQSGITVSQFVAKGNQGLGTFVGINGELILLDGHVFQLQAEGKIREAESSDRIPYGVAVNLDPDTTIKVKLHSKHDVDATLERFNDHAGNLFMSYRIEGRFKRVKCRTVRGEDYQGQPLSEMGEHQYVAEYQDIEGTMVGFRAPAAWQGFFVAGQHIHFIDAARKVGGHILELDSGDEVAMGISTVNNIHIELPTSDKFNAANFQTDDAGLKSVEG